MACPNPKINPTTAARQNWPAMNANKINVALRAFRTGFSFAAGLKLSMIGGMRGAPHPAQVVGLCGSVGRPQ